MYDFVLHYVETLGQLQTIWLKLRKLFWILCWKMV